MSRAVNPLCDTSTTEMTDDAFAVVNNPEIDIVVELIGGREGWLAKLGGWERE